MEGNINIGFLKIHQLIIYFFFFCRFMFKFRTMAKKNTSTIKMLHPRSGGKDDWIFSSLRSSPNIEQWREIIFLINFIDIKRYTCLSYNIFKFKRVEANIYIIIKIRQLIIILDIFSVILSPNIKQWREILLRINSIKGK